ncbi:phosphinothricin acetyltransferase [Pseudomonas duriflava]|uniref:L-methionine sulfoximine/L-methionine sulfone acetyltransferase n=1 Tax=Pseudomonas duriflava TaxID=459528 RepID=A0A562QNL0_9PSED|nr:GNAT family N-acetyltransferase [Pseudomonas duriflava]TWI58351.1 phosphinothricin acetyltransferase [Pseudomonas duriflava]
MTCSIVPASEADLPGILAIYNDAVENTTAIWNETLVDLDNRRAWLADRTAQKFPVLVAHDASGAVIGYASYCTWRTIEGFRHTVEHSVYVRSDQCGQGIGPQLMQALITCARNVNLHMMVAAIESGNAVSIRLHERLGFVTTGQMPEVGKKFGRWLDLTFMQLKLEPLGE